MTGFFIGAFVLAIVAVALVVWPLLRRPASTDFSRSQLNAAIYRDQLAELERDQTAGTLAQADYEQARTELQRRLLEDTASETAAASTTPGSRALPIGLGLALPLGAVLLYLVIGTPRAIDPPPAEKRVTQQDVERMVVGLAAKLEKEPGNLKGWAMLGRSYKAMGRYAEAVQAYARAGSLLDDSAELLLDYADTLAAANGGFDKSSLALIDKALRLEPENLQGLWMRGSAAFDAGQFTKAITDWETLQKQLPAGSEEARIIDTNLAEARRRKAEAGTEKGRKKK